MLVGRNRVQGFACPVRASLEDGDDTGVAQAGCDPGSAKRGKSRVEWEDFLVQVVPMP